ncbi:MAG: HD domain-containing protein [bacterium]
MSSKVLQFAIEAHKGQVRKYSGLPYVSHPVDVRNLLVSYLAIKGENGSLVLDSKYSDIESASYLHDVLEDCPNITEKDIENISNKNVLKIVKELTNPSKGIKAPRAERKKMDRDHLSVVSWEAKLIKLCDRICNLRDFKRECKDEKFLNLYADESRLLLECLKGTHSVLESILSSLIKECKNTENQ